MDNTFPSEGSALKSIFPYIVDFIPSFIPIPNDNYLIYLDIRILGPISLPLFYDEARNNGRHQEMFRKQYKKILHDSDILTKKR